MDFTGAQSVDTPVDGAGEPALSASVNAPVDTSGAGNYSSISVGSRGAVEGRGERRRVLISRKA